MKHHLSIYGFNQLSLEEKGTDDTRDAIICTQKSLKREPYKIIKDRPAGCHINDTIFLMILSDDSVSGCSV